MKHSYSIEVLYNFKCAQCKRLWSTSDYKVALSKDIFCPYCGFKAGMEKVNVSNTIKS